MTKAIGIRLPTEIMRKVEALSRKEDEDRSTIIRKLLTAGYKEFVANRAAQDYIAGKITFSEAAKQAELTIWEMEQYLVNLGFKSEYSIEDLENEMRILGAGRGKAKET